jgi:rhodanese-related sulfurtransferase
MAPRNIRRISFFTIALALFVLTISCAVAQSETTNLISPQKAYEALTGENPPLLIDVRTKAEFGAGHVKNALNVPLNEFTKGTYPKKIGEPAKDRPIIVFCHSGRRSGIARDILAKDGYTNTKNVRGGIIAWKDAELPIVK